MVAFRFDLCDDEAAVQFDALTLTVVEQVSTNEPGTLLYAAHTIAGEPLARLFYEVYAHSISCRAP